MLIDADFKGLEILCAAYLSQDKVLIDELRKGVDIHTDNQARLGLPSRLVAKVFVFRLIYGGSAFSYGHDPDFAHISISELYWQRAIDKFYNKYKGLHRWHISLVQEVVRSGKLVVPCTGRQYEFKRTKKGDWPRTQILNYQVQGLGADILSIARISLYKRLKSQGIDSKLISTVHDSILLDCPRSTTEEVCGIIKDVWRDLPKNFEAVFGVPLDLPCKAEIKIGPDWGNMEIYNAD